MVALAFPPLGNVVWEESSWMRRMKWSSHNSYGGREEVFVTENVCVCVCVCYLNSGL